MNEEGPLRSLPTALSLVWHAGRTQAALLFAASAAMGVAPVAAAWLVKVIVDRIGEGELEPLIAPVLGLALATLVMLAMPPLTTYLRSELERRVAVVVQRQLFVTINGFPGLRPFEDPVFHNELRLAQQGGETAPPIVLAAGVTAIQEGVTLVGFTLSLLFVSPLVALLALAAAVPGLMIERRMSRRQADLAFALSPHDRRKLFYGALQTDERAAKEIRLFGLGDHFLGRMLAEFRVINDGERRMDRAVLVRQLAIAALTALLGAAGLLIVARQAANGTLGAGDVFVVVAAIAGVQASAGGLVSIAGHLLESLHLLGHYRSFLARAGAEPAQGGTPCPPLRDGDRAARRLVPLRPTSSRGCCAGVNLTIPAGGAVALVGLNGAGKSTLVKLLCRFYDPSAARSTGTAWTCASSSPRELRGAVGAVFQDFMELRPDARRENIALGDIDRLDDRDRDRATRPGGPGVDDDARGAAARLRHAAEPDLLRRRDGGPATGVGALRRAVAADRGGAGADARPSADLLILDEPSAGLDAEAEHELHQRLLARRAGARRASSSRTA